MKRLILFALPAFVLVGCNQGDERLIEKAKIEGRETARAELQAQLDAKDQLVEKARAEGRAQAEEALRTQNDNLEKKSQQMEEDLATRHRFYQAVAGTYEGEIPTETGKFKVRFTLAPSLAPYTVNRTRQLEEVASDLNNLYFNAQVVEWNPANPLSGVGCRIEGIRPNLTRGEIVIAKESCLSLYQIHLSTGKSGTENGGGASGGSGSSKPTSAEEKKESKAVAISILAGNLDNVPEIRGQKQPTTNASVYSFSARKVEP